MAAPPTAFAALVLLDALYGDVDKFADLDRGQPRRFFPERLHGQYHPAQNTELMQILDEREISYVTEMPQRNRRDNVVFLATSGTRHNDYVTAAWAANPIKDVLQRQASRLVGGGAIARSSGGDTVR